MTDVTKDGQTRQDCGKEYGAVVMAGYSRYGVVLGKRSLLPTLTCGIRERNWSVWREATAAANLKLRYVSLQVPTYFDYLLDKFAAVRPVVEETICWNDK